MTSKPTRIDRYGREVRLDKFGLEYVRGDEATDGGQAWYVTPCCDASAKGSMALGEPATVCRACYDEVDPILGGIVEPLDEDETDADRAALKWLRDFTARMLKKLEES